MAPESLAELDETESGYHKSMVELEAYDGRKLKGFVYNEIVDPAPAKPLTPSKRYLGVIIKGESSLL